MRRWIPYTIVLAFLMPLTVEPGVSDAAPKKKGAAGQKEARARSKTKSKKRVALRAKASSKRSRATAGRPNKSPRPAILSILPVAIRCPADMVAVAGRVCVDRYETSVVDADSGAPWSPFYSPDLSRALKSFAFYKDRSERAPLHSLEATLALPAPPTFAIRPKAVSASRIVPQGYLSADMADGACRAAGKRLCTEAEWLTACRGEDQRDFPYGKSYEQGACNVYREHHPSALLHGDSSRYHDDPRNNFVEYEGRSLLVKTGASPRCASRWGNDAIYDMVGNLDEWVDDPNGVFVGGFFSRGTRAGCMSRIDAHPRGYSDYSTGTRCCSDPL